MSLKPFCSVKTVVSSCSEPSLKWKVSRLVTRPPLAVWNRSPSARRVPSAELSLRNPCTSPSLKRTGTASSATPFASESGRRKTRREWETTRKRLCWVNIECSMTCRATRMPRSAVSKRSGDPQARTRRRAALRDRPPPLIGAGAEHSPAFPLPLLPEPIEHRAVVLESERRSQCRAGERVRQHLPRVRQREPRAVRHRGGHVPE